MKLNHEVDIATGCWNWCGYINAKGYGIAKPDGRTSTTAHRAYYEMFVGPIQVGHTVDHLCRNRRCVNIHHLEAVPHIENLLRGDTTVANGRIKTHCINGHEFNDVNTLDRVRKNGYRSRNCRVCDRGRKRRVAELRKAAATIRSNGRDDTELPGVPERDGRGDLELRANQFDAGASGAGDPLKPEHAEGPTVPH